MIRYYSKNLSAKDKQNIDLKLDKIQKHHDTLVKNIPFEKYLKPWIKSRSFHVIDACGPERDE